MALVSQRLMMQASTHRILRGTLVTTATREPQVIHSIFGINSIKFAEGFNQHLLIFQILQFLQNLLNHKGNKR